MSFQQGLSGLNAAAKALDVTGNNIANANTVGFKQSQAQFTDVFAASLAGGAAAGAVGIGTKPGAVAPQMTQGNIRVTDNPLDLAINGNGFFRMSDSGSITYSRAGQFHLDKDGYITDSGARRLTGYGADANGDIVPSAPIDLQLVTTDIMPQVTTDVSALLNLDSRSAQPTTAVFSTTDPTSYNSSTSLSIFDSLGNPHVLSLYFVKTAAVNGWNVRANVDGTATSSVNLGAGAGNPATLAFGTSGALTTAMPYTMSIDLDAVATALGLTNGAASPLSVTLDLTGSTQYGATFGVNSLSQDGYTSGRLSGMSIGADGVIKGRYSNGQARDLGQVVLTNFNNNQGLGALGDSQWAETPDSGVALVGAPGTGALGLLQALAVEEANVDLTAELVNMITMQRVYQANAQSIKTQDAILQTLVNLR